MGSINDNLSTTPDDERDSAQTPIAIVRKLEEITGFTFVLDACASRETKKAQYYYGLDGATGGCPIADDALAADWSADVRRLVYPINGRFCSIPAIAAIYANMPFSRAHDWVKAMARNARNGVPVVGCCKDASDTDWFAFVERHASFLLIPDGRIEFLRPDGTRFKRFNKKTQKWETSGVNFATVFPVFMPMRADGLAPRIRFQRPKKYLGDAS